MNPSSLRVLFVNRMAGLQRGGGETFDLGMAAALAARGAHVEFLTGAPLFSGPPQPVEGFPAHYLHSPFLPWLPWDRMRGGWRIREAAFRCFEVLAHRWIVRHARGFDVIQICELPRLVHSLKRARCPAATCLRLTAPNFYDPVGGVGEADGLIASGTTIKTIAEKGVYARNIPNAVDTAVFHPGSDNGWRARHGIAESDWVAIYPARFQGFKNHALLLQAFRKVLDRKARARLVLAGDGPLLGETRKLAASLGVAAQTFFTGEIPQAEMADAMRAADLCVISSDYESFCFAAIEAMATGKPVVSTDCGWVPTLLEGGAGVVAAKGDANALAAAWRKVLGNETARKEMGEAGLAKVLAEYTWDRSAERLLELYDEIRHR
jgi:glycosyltransferase involved in cell wall biosynthesis